jgi:uncharacterized membrane protein
MTPLLAPLLVVHIAFALSLLVPAVALPLLSRDAGDPAQPGRVSAGLLWLQRHAGALGLGVAVTGVGLIAALGLNVLSQPWLLVALAIYAVNLAIAVFVQQPRLRRISEASATADSAEAERAMRAQVRRQRGVSYLMAVLIGAIGFLMSTKPALW